MNIETLRHMLGWCAIINYVMLLLWFLIYYAGRGWYYRLHSKFFRLSEAQFDAYNYAGMIFFKLAIFLFCIVPYLALLIIK
jgi:hypothetical protein